MRKLLAFAIVLLAVTTLFAESKITRSYKDVPVFVTHTGSANVMCYKCKEHTKRKPACGSCLGCPAWRMYNIPHKTIDGNKYTTYHCQHGHTLLVSLTSDDLR